MHTLIVGGGLSGLALADALTQTGADFSLIEARERFGGRVETYSYGTSAYDLGPAWYWEGQPRVAKMIARFGLRGFVQHTLGHPVSEDAGGSVLRMRGSTGMPPSWRIEGGFGALVRAMHSAIDPARVRLGCHAVRLEARGTGVQVTTQTGEVLSADRVVLALPPRMVAQLEFNPPLPPETYEMMQAVPTWMAGQAKCVALYKTPFWREAGLSGDAFSRAGPMVEIHDASPDGGGPAALFGFVGVPPQMRKDAAAMQTQAIAQLVRLFGPDAATPLVVRIKDWAQDRWTATTGDLAPLYAHPAYAPPPPLAGAWADRLLFGGTEVAPQFGGYIEGAFEAAEAALDALR